jgi:hypothetical protein
VSTTHLDEAAIEALAHDRADALTDAQRTHAAECSSCTEAVSTARQLSLSTGATLLRLAPEPPDLDAMVQRALAAAPATKPASSVRVLRASRAALAFSAAAGVLIAMASGAASAGSLSDLASLPASLRTAVALVGAFDRIATVRVPFGRTGAGFVLLAVLLMLLVPLRRLSEGARVARAEESAS